MYKRDIINFLFIVSFPIYGIGNYISAVKSPSIGYLISISFHVAIIIFYIIDLLYKRELKFRLNGNYFLMLLFLLSSAASLFIALNKGLPEATLLLTISKSLLLIVPFQSFVIVVLYNEMKDNLLRLTLLSLSLLLFVNLIGYFGLGLSNELHSIEGRLNFPFLDGFYSGAGLLAVISLLLLHYLQKTWKDPLRFGALSIYFLMNLAMFFLINSRLAILVFVLVMGLTVFRLIRMKGLYLVSMFTIPILLGSGALIYKVLQLPGLSTVLQRVDMEDVMTFNGRAFLWRDAMNWLLVDQQGLLLGNGYKGHYFLGLISDVAKLWNEKNVHHMHLHSTSLEVLVCQGLVFFMIFAFLFYQVYKYYKTEHVNKTQDGAFLPVIVFLLFILQVDTFLYLDSLGFVIFSVLVARIAITENARITQGITLNTRSESLITKTFQHQGDSVLQIKTTIH